MIVMTFTIELESGLSFVLQSALPLASDRSPDETHRRGRSKRSYGHGRRRTEIPEAEPPTAHPSRWQGQRCQATEGCAEGLVRMCVSHAASNETRCARLGTGAGVRRPPRDGSRCGRRAGAQREPAYFDERAVLDASLDARSPPGLEALACGLASEKGAQTDLSWPTVLWRAQTAARSTRGLRGCHLQARESP